MFNNDKSLFSRSNFNNNIITNNHSRVSSATISITASDPGFVPIGSRFAFLRVRSRQEKRFLLLIGGLSLICTLLLIVILIMTFSGNNEETKVCRSKDCIASAAMILQNMDTTADPCTDFYRYACGKWMFHHPIPDSSQNIDWFQDRKNSVKREIRDALLNSRGSEFEPKAVQQLRILFGDCLDTEAIEAKGLEPLRALLTELSISHKPALLQGGESAKPNPNFKLPKSAATAKMIAGLDVLIGSSVYPDPLNNSRNIFGLTAPSWKSPLPGEFHRIEWNLPSPIKKRQQLYRQRRNSPWLQREVVLRQQYMANVMQAVLASGLAGESAAAASVPRNTELGSLEEAAKTIYQFESKLYSLANTSITDIDFSMLTLDELQNMTDTFANHQKQNMMVWQVYFSRLYEDTNVTLQDIEYVQVQMSYVQNLANLLATTSPAVIEAAIWWQVVDTVVPFSIRALRELRRSYIEDLTYGQTVLSRSMVCAGVGNDLMGMAVSYMFATPTFMQSAQAKVGDMVNDIRDSFIDMVSQIKWMDDETRKTTLLKARAMKVHIGFPKWILKDGAIDNYYNGLMLEKGNYFVNVLALMKLFTKNMFKSLTVLNTVDTWASDPTDVNAYHSFQDNAITVPAAILQFPFYNLGLEVLNYGAIGSILGHELTHGFDNLGRLYDEIGNFRPWWSNSTAIEYESRTACFVEQYGKFHLPELHSNVDGYLTLGENIADNGGIRGSVQAYRRLRARRGEKLQETLPGMEHIKPEQLLYLAFTNLWCEQSTVMAMKWSLQESHAPNRARVWGSLSNSRSFAETWDCEMHSTMNPRDKCELW